MATIQAGSLIAGKYRLATRLSKGGMGSVWLAQHTQLEAPVVVKFMLPELVGEASARSRFEREAKAAAQIRSPFVVHVFAADTRSHFDLERLWADCERVDWQE